MTEPIPTTRGSDVGEGATSTNAQLPWRAMKPGLITWYPRFDRPTIKNRLETLGEAWDENRYLAALRTYDRSRHRVAFYTLVGAGLTSWMAASLYIRLSYASEPAQIQFVVSGAAFLLGTVMTVSVLIRIPASMARWRFFRHVGHVLTALLEARQDPSAEIDTLPILNNIGAAARALFLALLRSRFGWRSPPLVSDRALRLTSPLIDIDMPDDLHMPGKAADTYRELFCRFVHDVAMVVALGREDLIPRVRQDYPGLIRRSSNTDAYDRDLDYLNPMRNRGLWDIAKDFWYPLAPWLSLVVATAALVISVTR